MKTLANEQIFPVTPLLTVDAVILYDNKLVLRGILTNRSINEKVELEFEYIIETVNSHLESGGKYFRLIVRLFPPPDDLIGYIGFSIDDSDLKQMTKKGWMACNCDEDEIEDMSITKKTELYKLFFPPEEMKKVFLKENLIN